MNKAVLWIVILVIVLGGIYWAMSNKAPEVAPVVEPVVAPVVVEPTPAPEPEVANTLVLADVKAGKEVMVSSVTLNQDGSIVIHKQVKGAPGTVIGTLTLKKGSYTDQKVALNEAVKVGDTIYPMLHPDNGDGKYVAEEEGTPLNGADGKAVVLTMKVVK